MGSIIEKKTTLRKKIQKCSVRNKNNKKIIPENNSVAEHKIKKAAFSHKCKI